MTTHRPRCIGLALGSGAARGWAHFGVLHALMQAGIFPQVIAGSSIGAVVGAAYAGGKLEAYEQWVRQLDRRKVVGYFDLSLRGGLIKAQRVFEFLREQLPDQTIESLPRPFAAVATDLHTGEEVWLRDGSLFDALRASGAVPGMVTPVQLDGRWLVDGGLVNPVPVSLCRALGADFVIAVDLNTVLLQRRFRGGAPMETPEVPAPEPVESPVEEAETDNRLQALVRGLSADLRQLWRRDRPRAEEVPPSIFEVISTSIDIMQVRITRSRMAGDPPEMLISPRLPDFNLLDFDRALEAIEEGERAAQHALVSVPPILGVPL